MTGPVSVSKAVSLLLVAPLATIAMVMPCGCSSRAASPTDAAVGGASGAGGGGGGGGASAIAWAGDASATAGIARVLFLSIDGFHASDLERYIVAKPQSTLARLATVGARFPNARAPFPSDSFPSVLAWATGGTPRSTGVYYDLSYDRSLSPPGSDCSTRGAAVDYSDDVDLDNDQSNGGGGLNEALLPRDPARACAPVYPHQYLRVNTIFEAVKGAGGRTAWSDKHLTYEVLQGPSGMGVDDLYDLEVAAFKNGQAYDQLKVKAVLNEIDGKDHAGAPAAVPALFGMNFQAVSMAQKSSGYLDAAGTPTTALAQAIDGVDVQIGSLVDELVAQGLWSTTLFIVGASHGQSPIDPTRLRRISPDLIASLANGAVPGVVATVTEDTVALVWLTDPSKTDVVAQALLAQQATAGIDHLITGADLTAMYADPAADPRVPNIIDVVIDGTIYTSSGSKVGEHGGFSDDDRNVALLVAGRTAGAALVPDAVETRQLAPTILTALGIAPGVLAAVTAESTAALPGLSLGPP